MKVNKEQVYENCCLVEELDEFLASYGFKRVMTKWAVAENGSCPGWGDGLWAKGQQ